MARDEAYRRPKRPSEDEEYWLTNGTAVVLDLLANEHACTISEIESRTSDRTWNPLVFPRKLNPHVLTNVRAALLSRGDIEPMTGYTRSHPVAITTWSLPPIRGRKRKIEDAAARKRLLTARHNGWSERGGRGRGLLGAAGENALASALAHPGPVVNASGSTTTVLGVDLNVAGLGEIDNTAWLIDHSNASKPELILVLFEAKNTRQWYYAHDPDVVLFLTKAAVVQAANPAQLVMPVFVCRQVHFTLWELGEHHGFLPVTVENQLVLPDHEVTPERFAEVRDGLYADLVLGDKPTNRHIGAVTKAIPKYARHRADLWRQNHGLYLPAHPV